MFTFISLCMIVKNEEKVLRRCLESVKNYVDEIIIVDTGSNDKTKEIAFSFTNKVYDFKWIDNFAAARNFAQEKATGEMIIYLDADEYVEESNFKQIIHQLKESKELNKYDAFVVNQINFVGTMGGNVGNCPTVRIYKNNIGIKFQREIHEQIFKEKGDLLIGVLGLNIYHSGYLKSVSIEKNKNQRNEGLIKNKIKQNSKNGFDYYNLANEYLSQWEVEAALLNYRKAFKLEGSIKKMWVPMAVERMISCLVELKRYEEALKIIDGAIEEWPNAADFHSQKAIVYFKQNRFEDAEVEMRQLILDTNSYNTVQSLSYLNFVPYLILGEISEYKNNLSDAVLYYSQALNFNDKDIDAFIKMNSLIINNESTENIIKFISNNKKMNNEVNQMYFLKTILDNGSIDLIEYYMKEWKFYPSIGFEFKYNIVKKRYNYTKSLLNKNSIDEILFDGWSSPYDILVLALHRNNTEIFSKLLDSSDGKDYASLKFLFEDKAEEKNEAVKSSVLKFLNHCIKNKEFSLIDIILEKTKNLKINIEIGNLFYKNKFEQIAIDLYGTEDYNQLDEQAYINIIEFFYKNQNEVEALRWIFAAIEHNFNDYRLFKMALELLEQRNAYEDVLKVFNIASQYYPESTYFKQFTYQRV